MRSCMYVKIGRLKQNESNSDCSLVGEILQIIAQITAINHVHMAARMAADTTVCSDRKPD